MPKKENSARLGKGLSAIFGEDVNNVLEDIQQGKTEVHEDSKFEVAVKDVKPNPYQPRKNFDDDKIQELADSIRLHGVFTPILVKKAVKGYELIAGERRLRASKVAGLKTIPAILMEFDDQQMMEIALLENIQREDLNAIEEAQGYEKLIKKLDYTQEELAKRIGKSREHVANMLRLLKLPKAVQQLSLIHICWKGDMAYDGSRLLESFLKLWKLQLHPDIVAGGHGIPVIGSHADQIIMLAYKSAMLNKR